MFSRLICLAAILVVACSLVVMAQTAPAAAPQAAKPEIKHVPATYTDPSSGKEMYKQYCASCHGLDGKGDGPAQPALKVPATNLTTLSLKNGGMFPGAHISAVLQGDSLTPAHGSKDMPVWGPLFRNLSQGHDAEVQQRIANINAYIESLQKK